MSYAAKKARARQLAIDWQANSTNHLKSLSYFLNWWNRWERIGRKYGLIREFKENGIL